MSATPATSSVNAAFCLHAGFDVEGLTVAEAELLPTESFDQARLQAEPWRKDLLKRWASAHRWDEELMRHGRRAGVLPPKAGETWEKQDPSACDRGAASPGNQSGLERLKTSDVLIPSIGWGLVSGFGLDRPIDGGTPIEERLG